MKHLAGMMVGVAALLACAAVQAQDDPDFLSVSAGAFDVTREADRAAEFVLQYRSDQKLWFVKPHAGVMATTDGSVYGFAGLLVDLYFGNRWVLTPSTAVGAYHSGGKDLGRSLQFRWGAELAYRFDDRGRLGIGLYHMSNGGLDDDNPGAESALLTYSLPLPNLLGR